jgi:hypothetical protein
VSDADPPEPAGRGGRPGRRLRLGACLSLSGRHARFGRQAALGLEVWQALAGAADLLVVDDHSDPGGLEDAMTVASADADVLLGPYSTHLMRTAGRVAAATGRLLWNHGGSGDDVQRAHPGHVVSVPTPASRYAEPFLRLLADGPAPSGLWIAEGRGRFGRQVAAGAEAMARRLGIAPFRIAPFRNGPAAEPGRTRTPGRAPRPSAPASAGAALEAAEPPAGWALLCAGSFEEDVETVGRARALRRPPRTICAVAAGVLEFGRAVGDPAGVFGVGQWAPDQGRRAEVGPIEEDFVTAYASRAGGPPDYPAVQAAAAAALAVHCAERAGGTSRGLLWEVVTSLDTETMFGRFKVAHHTGAQVGHLPVLTRWAGDRLVPG